MSLLKIIRTQFGKSVTAANNFTLTAEADNGTMKLARGNAGATTQDILTVDADGRIAQGLAPAMVRLNTANGHGSTNTCIRRFTNIVTNQGNDIKYADSATLGATFTINKAGVYSMSYADQFNVQSHLGLSLNATQLSTSVAFLAVGEQLTCAGTSGANNANVSSWCGYLPAGAVVRPHTGGSAQGTTVNACQFTITRVA